MKRKTNFKPGDKVICIKKEKLEGEEDRNFTDVLEIGKEYEVEYSNDDYHLDKTNVFTVELKNVEWQHASSNFKLKK